MFLNNQQTIRISQGLLGFTLFASSSIVLAVPTQQSIDLTGPLSCSTSTSCTVDLTGNATVTIGDDSANEENDFLIDIVFDDQKYLQAVIGPGSFGGEFVFELDYVITPTGTATPVTISGSASGYLSDENGNNIRNFNNNNGFNYDGAGTLANHGVVQEGPNTSITFYDVHFTLFSVDLADFPAGLPPVYGGTFDPTQLVIGYSGQGDGSLAIGQAEETVPEPATVLLVGLGLAGLGFVRRRRLNA